MYLEIKPEIEDKLLKSIYKYCKRNNMLKNKDKDAVLKEFNKKNIEIKEILLKRCGRFFQYEAFLIKTGRINILFPIIDISDLKNKKSGINGIEEDALKLEWFFPPYFGMGDTMNNISEILKEKDYHKKDKLFLSYLSTLYSNEHLSSFFVFNYSIFPYISDYKKIILEAFKAFNIGLTHLAVQGLIPVIEGVIRHLCKKHDVFHEQLSINLFYDTIQKLKKNYIKKYQFYEIDWIPDEFIPSNVYDGFDEYIQITNNFSNYISKYLYQNSNKYEGKNQLNRHGILHGLFTDYNSEINFYKLITILDMLCFLIIFDGYNSSLSAPNITDKTKELIPDSLKLKKLFDCLRILSESVQKEI